MTKVKGTTAKVGTAAVAAPSMAPDSAPSFPPTSDSDSESQYGVEGRDFDPEDADFGSTFDSRGSQSKRVRYQPSSRLEDASRQHYRNLPGRQGPGEGRPSRLRSKVPLPIDDEAFMDGRYAGRKVSRADLGFDDASEDSEKEDPLEEDESEEEYGDGSGDEGLSQHLSAPKTKTTPSGGKKLVSAPKDSDGGEVEEQLAALRTAQEHQLEMVATKAVEDAVRGTVVREQLVKWQTALDVRIHLQPLLTTSHRLPLKRVIYETAMVDREMQERVLSQLQDLCRRLTEGWDNIVPCASLSEGWESQLSKWDAHMSPKWRESLDQWHQRVSLNGPEVLSAKRQMKVINQSLWSQMETALRDHDRLLRRAFTRRSGVTPIGEEGKDDAEAKARPSSVPDETVVSAHFDDGDFFSLLVRDWVASGAAAATAGNNGSAADAAKTAGLTISRVRAHRTGIDPRASKGRKLRYDVQERLVNYMVPVRDVTTQWPDEKIDALYASTFRQPEDV